MFILYEHPKVLIRHKALLSEALYKHRAAYISISEAEVRATVTGN